MVVFYSSSNSSGAGVGSGQGSDYWNLFFNNSRLIGQIFLKDGWRMLQMVLFKSAHRCTAFPDEMFASRDEKHLDFCSLRIQLPELFNRLTEKVKKNEFLVLGGPRAFFLIIQGVYWVNGQCNDSVVNENFEIPKMTFWLSLGNTLVQ